MCSSVLWWFKADFVYGSWEKMRCSLPPAAFPSQDYKLTVSNDAGITHGWSDTVTYMDYSLSLPGTGSTMDFPQVTLGTHA